MFNRKRNTTLEGVVGDFATTPGVSFCVHVFYRDTGDATLKMMSLGAARNKTSLLNVSSVNHPDQEYLRAVTTGTLSSLSGRTIVRVEVDDTISFCGTGTGQCGKVVPEWIKLKFPTAPAFLFIHKSDRPAHTSLGKHAYNLYDESENDSWDWTDGDQTLNFSGAPALRFVAVYTCRTTGCLNSGKSMALIEARNGADKALAAFSHVPAKDAKCGRCSKVYEYQRTRLLIAGEKMLVEQSWA